MSTTASKIPSFKWTPWGPAQSVTERVPGVFEITTAGHGGIRVTPKVNATIPAALRRADGWYEEDCDWCLVALAFPAAFADQLDAATRTARNWRPDQYTAFTGIALTPEDSFVLRQRAERAAAKGKLQVVAAWGDWATNVPPGRVGVAACIDGRDGQGQDRYFLVYEEDYKAGGVFVIDPAVHPEVAPVDGQSPFQPPRREFPEGLR